MVLRVAAYDQGYVAFEHTERKWARCNGLNKTTSEERTVSWYCCGCTPPYIFSTCCSNRGSFCAVLMTKKQKQVLHGNGGKYQASDSSVLTCVGRGKRDIDNIPWPKDGSSFSYFQRMSNFCVTLDVNIKILKTLDINIGSITTLDKNIASTTEPCTIHSFAPKRYTVEDDKQQCWRLLRGFYIIVKACETRGESHKNSLARQKVLWDSLGLSRDSHERGHWW